MTLSKNVPNPNRRPFSQWSWDGRHYLTLGLIQLWWNSRICPLGQAGRDPPELQPEFQNWCDERGVEIIMNTWIGPPQWVFNDKKTRQEFVHRYVITRAQQDAEMNAWYEANPERDPRENNRKILEELRDAQPK